MIVKAKLIKLKTDDGFFELFEDVDLGKEYEVDTSTIGEYEWYNTVHDVKFKKLMIEDVNGGLLPLEVLEFNKEGLN